MTVGVLRACLRLGAGERGAVVEALRRSRSVGQAAADREHDDAQAVPEQPRPSAWLLRRRDHYHRRLAAGRAETGRRQLATAGIPVSVVRAGSPHPADQGTTLAAGDRVSLLTPAAQDSQMKDAELPGARTGTARQFTHGREQLARRVSLLRSECSAALAACISVPSWLMAQLEMDYARPVSARRPGSLRPEREEHGRGDPPPCRAGSGRALLPAPRTARSSARLRERRPPPEGSGLPAASLPRPAGIKIKSLPNAAAPGPTL
jgi:hypothetical protein